MLTVERLQSKIGKSVEFVAFLAPFHRLFRPQPWILTGICILPTGRFLESMVFLAITVLRSATNSCLWLTDRQLCHIARINIALLGNVRQKAWEHSTTFLKPTWLSDEKRYLLKRRWIQCSKILDVTGLIFIPLKSLTDKFLVQPFTLTNGTV